eukprot:COSAG04_NODE_3019_length_3273_cov_2.829553_8_plen_259_part_00
MHFGEALLGLDALKDRDLMWIAEEALRAPVPQGWVELADPANGVPYYYSTVDETTTWDHPLDGKYKLIAAQELENKRKKKSRMAEEQTQTQQPAAVTPAGSAGAATPGSVASEEGESMSPAAERVRQTSKDLGTLKQLFAEGLLGEEVYAAKQEEVLRNCLSVLKPQPAAADAAEAGKASADATTVRQAPLESLMRTTQLSTERRSRGVGRRRACGHGLGRCHPCRAPRPPPPPSSRPRCSSPTASPPPRCGCGSTGR